MKAMAAHPDRHHGRGSSAAAKRESRYLLAHSQTAHTVGLAKKIAIVQGNVIAQAAGHLKLVCKGLLQGTFDFGGNEVQYVGC